MWLINIAIGAFLCMIFTAMLGEPLNFFMADFFSLISPAKKGGIKGEWDIPFKSPENDSISVVNISYFPGIAVGRLALKLSNRKNIRKRLKCPLLLQGKFTGDYFTGTWFDPNETSRIHGAFQMRLLGDRMLGKRIGFNQNGDIICDNWEWCKHDIRSYEPLPRSLNSDY